MVLGFGLGMEIIFFRDYLENFQVVFCQFMVAKGKARYLISNHTFKLLN